ncbi:MAG: 16S rRNA (guanine(527)-N(7))-methyltransferase RsmG [Bacteroidales bacterium]|nr:16S rRNA (guanine(527)-N(7))-methyltransferase RsmG [Bacteroidales bacterium]
MNSLIEKYFPSLSETQRRQFEDMGPLYADWNSKINLISRKDIDFLYEHHILHSLAIARFIRFKEGSRIMDVGTGGGFPGIPLAVMFPDCEFLLIDSIGKKIKAAADIAGQLQLKNVALRHARVEEEKGLFDFVVSRAVMPLPDLYKLCRKNIAKRQMNALPNGLICLKGGELQHEIQPFRQMASQIDLSKEFEEEYYQTKKLVYLPV